MNTVERRFCVLLGTFALAIATTSACSENDDTITGSGGHAGAGGGAGGAGGHGGACKGCGDLLSGDAVAAAELCGFRGHGAGNAVLCEQGSSCQTFTDLHACMCGADAAAPGACNACTMNACINGRPDTPCETCVTSACPSAFETCRADVVAARETP